jgi:hypothetical protein
MKKATPVLDNDPLDDQSTDLTRRLARYRTRVEAEGRKRSLQVIDRAIEDVGKVTALSNRD